MAGDKNETTEVKEVKRKSPKRSLQTYLNGTNGKAKDLNDFLNTLLDREILKEDVDEIKKLQDALEAQGSL